MWGACAGQRSHCGPISALPAGRRAAATAPRMARLVVVALGVALTAAAAPSPPPPTRVWVDAFGFARGETLPLRDAVLVRGCVWEWRAEAGGLVWLSDLFLSPLQASPLLYAQASYVTSATLSVKGYWRPESWDFYYGPRSACERAAAAAARGARVNCVAGAAALTAKDAAAAALAAAYGDGGRIPQVPPGYALPCRAWDALAAAAASPASPWALKSTAHRGAGVTIVDGAAALAAGLAGGGAGVVQAFIEPQARVSSAADSPPSRFYVRVWALLAAGAPPRAYLLPGGLVLGGGGGRVVNLWLERGVVVPLAALAPRIVPPPANATEFADRLHGDIRAALGAAVAAAAPELARAAAPAAPALAAQLVGADFAVAPNGRALLLEINEAPSMARLGKGEHVSGAPREEADFDAAKEGAASSLLAFVREAALVEGHPSPCAGLSPEEAAAVAAASAEAVAAAAVGLAPLFRETAAGIEAAIARRPPARSLWASLLRRALVSRGGAYAARALSGAAPAAALAAARWAGAALGEPDPDPPPEGVAAGVRLLARCARWD